MNEQLSCHHFGSIGGVRGCLFCPCCHVWSLLSKKTTPTLPLLHRQAKKKVDSCSGYRPEIPAERAAAGGEGRQRRRVAARPWGEEALCPRGRASRSVDGGIDSVRDDVILAHSTALLLSGPAAACTNQCQASDETCSALAWARARPSRQQHSYPNCSKPLRGDTGLPQYFRPDLPSISVPGDK
jgi:hypothetical protein